jgi:uncharacterized protein (DUF2384 family)
MLEAKKATKPEPGPVVTKAVVRAADVLKLSGKTLGAILGISESSVSRMPKQREIEKKSKEWECAMLFLRIFRSLEGVLGGNEEAERDWFHAPNAHLGGKPVELVQSVKGLIDVAQYLDAMRGKI